MNNMYNDNYIDAYMLLIPNFTVITHFSLPTMKTSNHPMGVIV